jgi:hypothetical protein
MLPTEAAACAARSAANLDDQALHGTQLQAAAQHRTLRPDAFRSRRRMACGEPVGRSPNQCGSPGVFVLTASS